MNHNNINSDHPIDPIPKTICFVQITRAGDIIQTLRVAQATKISKPSYRFILVARKQFALPLKFILEETFSKIYYVDSDTLKKSDNLTNCLENLYGFIDSINNNETIDLLLNFSYSKSSSYLSNLIRANYKFGLDRDEKGSLSIFDKWSQYIYSTVMNGPLNPFSLEDIYRFVIGCKEAVPFIKTAKKNIIVIHPFASHSKKSWNPFRWSETINALMKIHTNYSFYIVGGDNDTQAQDEIINGIYPEYGPRIKKGAGKYNLSEVFSLLKNAKLFIGHDSLVGHLSSLIDIPSITVSLGPVRAIESSPYSNLNIVLSPRTSCHPCFLNDSCDYYQCHYDIPYSVVSEIAEQLLNSKQIDVKILQAKIPPIQLQKTSILLAKTNNNILTHVDLLNNTPSISQVFKVLYRVAWYYFFEEKEEKTSLPKLNKDVTKQLKNIIPGIQYLFELSNFGKKYTEFLLAEAVATVPSINKIKEYSMKIEEIDVLQNKVKETFEILSPLVDYFKVVRSNLGGINVIQIAQNCFMAYEEQAIMCSTIYELATQAVQDSQQTNTKVTNI